MERSGGERAAIQHAHVLLRIFLQIFVPDFETSTDHWWVMGGIMIKMTFDHYICLDL